jgi:ATP synthase protein I
MSPETAHAGVQSAPGPDGASEGRKVSLPSGQQPAGGTRSTGVDDQGDSWDGEVQPAWRALSREEAQALIERQPSVSPWRVVAVQAAVGVLMALVLGWVWGEAGLVWSALYGAGVVVVPGLLMARGMTSQFSRMNVGTAAVSFMLWELLKIGVSVALLMLAPKLVHGLSWPALLAALVVCLKVYWVALLWRGRVAAKKN